MHRNLASLYTNNERSERGIKETISFNITSKEENTYESIYPRKQNNCIPKTVKC